MVRARTPVTQHEATTISADLTPVLVIIVSASTLCARNKHIVRQRRRIRGFGLALKD